MGWYHFVETFIFHLSIITSSYKLIQNLYILDLYKNVGKPSSGEKRSGSYSGVISSLLRVVDKYINDDETIRLTKLLINKWNYFIMIKLSF